MKRKYGAALKRETIAEENMRKAAQLAKNNRFSFGSKSRKGSATAYQR
jgi:hypothetical protein